MAEQAKVHVAHVVYSFATGGLENGVVNIINTLPAEQYQHSIICVSDHDEAFFQRIKSGNAQIFNLNKPAGKDLSWLFRCWKLLRRLQPDVVHTRNLSALEAQFAAFFSGIKLRIHGEHGWDVRDLGGVNTKYQKIRKVFKPFIHQYIGLSREACLYLQDKIHVKEHRINHICNGVDIDKFAPELTNIELPDGFKEPENLVFGTVGRLAGVKNQTFLMKGFIALCEANPQLEHHLKLIVVGDGILLPELKQMALDSGLEQSIWFAGLRSDIPELMRCMDVFVLPSLAEGISNTLLEAMASGLPIIATKVGGNAELMMREHQSTHLIEVDNVEQLQAAMAYYLDEKNKLAQDSEKVRTHCVENFSIKHMVDKYHQLYQKVNQKEKI